MTTPSYSELLRNAGLRSTEGRLALLDALAKESAPVTVETLVKRLGSALNQVSVYRALEALVEANIVARVDLGHEHAHFELLSGRPHHHHAVCRSCGLVEDIQVPHAPSPQKAALKTATKFAFIDRYSFEFFGLCKSCA
ncbi:MAG TPA: Fur family transcriptional regulator [Candidatus Paceibacterota bacterium]|nr:Fur family transcriptional regulator [Candidatus Paceibacterota bacterium]